jgi:hypothetical protein
MSTPSRPPFDGAQGKPGMPHPAAPGSPPAPPRAPAAGIFASRPIGGLGVPAQKAKNFKGTLVRLLEYLRPHQAGLVVVILAGAIGTVFQVLGPKILGMVGKDPGRRWCRRDLVCNPWRNKDGDLLLFPVLFEGEIFRFQTGDGLAFLVGHNHIHDHKPSVGTNGDRGHISGCLLGT